MTSRHSDGCLQPARHTSTRRSAVSARAHWWAPRPGKACCRLCRLRKATHVLVLAAVARDVVGADCVFGSSSRVQSSYIPLHLHVSRRPTLTSAMLIRSLLLATFPANSSMVLGQLPQFKTTALSLSRACSGSLIMRFVQHGSLACKVDSVLPAKLIVSVCIPISVYTTFSCHPSRLTE